MCSQKLKVLIIDNDEDDYGLIRAFLSDAKGCEFELEWVATYDKGIEIIKRQLHEVYLIDYRLGEHNGLELLCAAIEAGCRRQSFCWPAKGITRLIWRRCVWGQPTTLKRSGLMGI